MKNLFIESTVRIDSALVGDLIWSEWFSGWFIVSDSSAHSGDKMWRISMENYDREDVYRMTRTLLNEDLITVWRLRY